MLPEPAVAFALKVVLDPLQIGLDERLGDAVGTAFTVIVIVFDVAGDPVTHALLEVITQVILLPFVREEDE